MEELHFNLCDQIGLNDPRVSNHVEERFQLVLFLSFAINLLTVLWPIDVVLTVVRLASIHVELEGRQYTASEAACPHDFAEVLQIFVLDFVVQLLTVFVEIHAAVLEGFVAAFYAI
jgi:hypothetical protein